MEFQIENMNCGGCAKGVTKAIQSVDPQAAIDIDLATKAVRVASATDAERPAAALDAAGFPAVRK